MRLLIKNYPQLAEKVAGKPFAHTITEAQTLMQKWAAERDQQKFFEMVIADKDEAKQLLDICKSINEFDLEQHDKYVKLFAFLDENRDNFGFLPEDQKPTIEALQKIKTDETPWEHLPSYLKMQKTLNKQLGATRQQLVDQVTAAYNKVFDELETYADKMSVERKYLDDRETTIKSKTAPNNFYALKDALNTTPYFNAQILEINSHVDGGSGKEPVIKFVHLQTHTNPAAPLKNETDIDNYLQGLKDQLIKLLGNNDGIIIN